MELRYLPKLFNLFMVWVLGLKLAFTLSLGYYSYQTGWRMALFGFMFMATWYLSGFFNTMFYLGYVMTFQAILYKNFLTGLKKEFEADYKELSTNVKEDPEKVPLKLRNFMTVCQKAENSLVLVKDKWANSTPRKQFEDNKTRVLDFVERKNLTKYVNTVNNLLVRIDELLAELVNFLVSTQQFKDLRSMQMPSRIQQSLDRAQTSQEKLVIDGQGGNPVKAQVPKVDPRNPKIEDLQKMDDMLTNMLPNMDPSKKSTPEQMRQNMANLASIMEQTTNMMATMGPIMAKGGKPPVPPVQLRQRNKKN